MTQHDNTPPKNVLAIVPAQRAFVAHMANGKIVETTKIASHADPIGTFLDALYDRIGEESLDVVIQSAPFTTKFLSSEANVRFARQLSETAIRWVTICEQDGVFYCHVNRGRWIKSLSEHPTAITFQENGETRLDTPAVAKRLDVHSSEFADVASLAYWYSVIGWQNPKSLSEEDTPRRASRRNRRAGAAA